MSNKEKAWSLFTTSLKVGLPLLAAAELSHFAFPSRERKDILKRDTCCQLADCGSSKDLTIHHIIPTACSNGIHRHEIPTGSEYVSIYLAVVREFIASFPDSEQGKIRHNLKEVLDQDVNGLTLCNYHHSHIHSVQFDQTDLYLMSNSHHPQRPKTLRIADTTQFLSEVILPLTLDNL